jgi:hypothetical protein
MPHTAPVTRIGYQREVLSQAGTRAVQRRALGGGQLLKVPQGSTDRG